MFKIPQERFRFLSDQHKHNIDWKTVYLTSDTGYFVECDLSYPEGIQEHTKDFPLCPENVVITYDMLSPFQKMSLEQIYGRTDYKQNKLTATFLPKKKMYVYFFFILRLSGKMKNRNIR